MQTFFFLLPFFSRRRPAVWRGGAGLPLPRCMTRCLAGWPSRTTCRKASSKCAFLVVREHHNPPCLYCTIELSGGLAVIFGDAAKLVQQQGDTMRKTEEQRLEELRKRASQIKVKIGKIEARKDQTARKQETRLKVLVGAALLVDGKHNQATADFVREVLQRAVTAERDKEFLQSKGWLAGTVGKEGAENLNGGLKN